MLLHTMTIINNNLPYRLGEYDESLLFKELVFKDEMRTTLNHTKVARSIVELYASTKAEVVRVLKRNKVPNTPSLAMVTDFWTCKTQNTKFLGLRVYYVNNDFEFKSVLLGVRQPQLPGATARHPCGVPAMAPQDHRRLRVDARGLCRATSDSGSDVKRMLKSEFALRWEWCMPHLTNCATKMACGLVKSKATSKNPEMTTLLSKIVKTVYEVKHIEIMGSHFADLCDRFTESNSTDLLEYRDHRFMGMRTSIFFFHFRSSSSFLIAYAQIKRFFFIFAQVSSKSSDASLTSGKRLNDDTTSVLLMRVVVARPSHRFGLPTTRLSWCNCCR